MDHPPAPPCQVSHLLIFGGSQGAQAINSSMLEAVEQSPILRESVTLTHQTGADDYERVRRGYEALGLQVDVQPFLFDMPKELAKADLVICRAGASTLAELAAYGKVSILIPFPHATHNHQEMNARAMEELGAARMLRQANLNGRKLAEEIEYMIRGRNPERGRAREILGRRAARLWDALPGVGAFLATRTLRMKEDEGIAF